MVRDIDAHSWVEVYFPRYGWVTFDPTPPPRRPRSQLDDAGAERHRRADAPPNSAARLGQSGDRPFAARRPRRRPRRRATRAAAGSCPSALGRRGARGAVRRRRARRAAHAVRDARARARRAAARAAPHGPRPVARRDAARARERCSAAPTPARGLPARRARPRASAPAARADAARSAARCAASSARASACAGALRAWWALPPLPPRRSRIVCAGRTLRVGMEQRLRPLHERAPRCWSTATTTRPSCRWRARATSSPTRPRSARRSAARCSARGATARRAAEFEAVVEHAPTNDYALFCLGRSLQQLGRHAEARQPLALASCLRPERADYSKYRGQARRRAA